MNGLIEADIYGNVNSTHVMGSAIQNGIGGSGVFARNAFVSIFMTPLDGEEGHDLGHRPAGQPCRPRLAGRAGVITEQGLADLRGLSPRQRAKVIIANARTRPSADAGGLF